MVIRFATESERKAYGLEHLGEYDVALSIDRRSQNILGVVGFDRTQKEIVMLKLETDVNKDVIKDKLLLVANRQMNKAGKSFHDNYPRYAKYSEEAQCNVCNQAPMPEGMEDVATLDYAWVVAEPKAQGRLFGKCVVGLKAHNVHFYDLEEDIMIGFMKDVQKVAKALHEVTHAVKINYEMHGNSGPHLHCHLFPRYLDDDFPGLPIDYHLTEPSPYEDDDEYQWFINEMRKRLS